MLSWAFSPRLTHPYFTGRVASRWDELGLQPVKNKSLKKWVISAKANFSLHFISEWAKATFLLKTYPWIITQKMDTVVKHYDDVGVYVGLKLSY